MRKVIGSDPRISLDHTGGIIITGWVCPYCKRGYEEECFFSSDTKTLEGDFEVLHVCEWCGKSFSIVCIDPTLFP